MNYIKFILNYLFKMLYSSFVLEDLIILFSCICVIDNLICIKIKFI